MTEKFTPGEWEVEEHELAVGNYAMVGFRIRTDSKIICAAKSNELKNKPEMQANAHLIAAAPEMCRVLSGICLEKSARICNYAPESCKVCAINRALKQARGEA